jgi:curli production assembly/transport component CsgF
MAHRYPHARLTAALLWGLIPGAGAGELTHTFVNPDFGGSPLNGSYLLANATAQNDHKAHVKPTASTTASASSKTDSATQFAQQVNQLVMSNLAYRLVGQAFGSSGEPIKSGSSIDTGINTVTVDAYEGGTRITITDNSTGGKSVITIPSY